MEVDFNHFLEKFPVIEFPITISEDTYIEIGEGNEPLPGLMIEQYLAADGDDEFTEYIACFRLPKQAEFEAVVFWKAGLMVYEYILATYSRNGDPLAAEVIAGTVVKDELMIQTVATIDKELTIFMATGASSVKTGEAMDAANNKMKHLEILENGQIV
jgi:hypothetical protein